MIKGALSSCIGIPIRKSCCWEFALKKKQAKHTVFDFSNKIQSKHMFSILFKILFLNPIQTSIFQKYPANDIQQKTKLITNRWPQDAIIQKYRKWSKALQAAANKSLYENHVFEMLLKNQRETPCFWLLL